MSIWHVNMDEASWNRIFGPKVPEPKQSYREIHISDVRTFLDCRRKWDYTSTLRLGFEPPLLNMNLWLGRTMHEALARWYVEKNARETLDYFEWMCMNDVEAMINLHVSDKYNDLMVSTMELGLAMLRHYIIWSRRNDKFEVIAVELTGRVLLPQPARTMVVGRLDLVGEDRAGKVFVMDHKTAARLPNVQDVQIDTQALTYLFLASQHPIVDGRPIDRFVFSYLHKKEPLVPRILKNGALSRAKLGQTSVEMYAKALHDAGQSWDAYPDVWLELNSKPNPYFARHIVRRSKKALQLHMTDLSAIAMEMLAPVPNIYPSPDRFRCNWCEFRDVCRIQSEGVDPSIALRAGFQRRKGWH